MWSTIRKSTSTSTHVNTKVIEYRLREEGSGIKERPQGELLAVALTASSLVLMPALGWAKIRLGRRLRSGATRGEGVQNLLCAAQAAAALAALLGAGAGLAWLDPIAALFIAGIAVKEGAELWRGTECGCQALPGGP